MHWEGNPVLTSMQILILPLVLVNKLIMKGHAKKRGREGERRWGLGVEKDKVEEGKGKNKDS